MFQLYVLTLFNNKLIGWGHGVLEFETHVCIGPLVQKSSQTWTRRPKRATW